MLNQIFMGIYCLNKRHQEKTRDATMKVCAACEQEQVKSVQFCGKCGGSTFLSVPEFLTLQSKRREASIDDLSQRRIRSQAILAIRNMEAAPYCSSCDIYFRPEEGAKHCTRCGKDIRDERMAPQSIFQHLQPQFPSLMSSYKAFEKLRDESPEPLVGTKLALSTVAEAARKYWAWNTFSTRK